MTTGTASRLAWGLWFLSFGSLASVFAYAVFGPPTDMLESQAGALVTITTVVFIAAFATVGALVASRRPENPIGWLLNATGLCYALATASLFIALQPWGERFAAWLGDWIWGLGLALPITFIPLLFPDGHLPSRRWRPVAWIAAIGIIAFVIGSAFIPGVLPESEPAIINPLGIGGELGRTVFGALRSVGLVVFLLMMPFALASLVFRYRRADGAARAQLRWLVLAGVFLGLGLLTSNVVGRLIENPDIATDVTNAIVSLAATAIPIAIGFAILKARLYDIDLVIRKTVVVGAMALFIALVYAAIVGLGSQLFDSSTLSFTAAVVLALAFQPARDRARKVADRLVYGKRATPYEVLADFSGRMGETYDADDVLPRMAQVLSAGTGAEVAVVWLRVEGILQAVAVSPSDATFPAEPPGDAVDVLHQSERLGALSVVMPASDPLDPARRKLIEDLAAQAGLVLRNVRLIEELRASRQRVVAAQDEERRRLERDLHDGAQQQLVALAVQLKLARTMVDRDVAKAGVMIDGLQGAAGAALEDLRDLARGIYPPLLADKGLVAALEAQARKAAMPVRIAGEGIERYPQDAEATVYFCVLEALNNVAKYANASNADVSLARQNGHLVFTVTDDGMGFDPDAAGYGTGLRGMADRLDAIGGALTVESRPGAGTSISGTVAVEARS